MVVLLVVLTFFRRVLCVVCWYLCVVLVCLSGCFLTGCVSFVWKLGVRCRVVYLVCEVVPWLGPVVVRIGFRNWLVVE